MHNFQSSASLFKRGLTANFSEKFDQKRRDGVVTNLFKKGLSMAYGRDKPAQRLWHNACDQAD
jgi:hypothetical protein